MSNDNEIYDRLKRKIAEKCLKANIDWSEDVIFGMSRNGEVKVLPSKIPLGKWLNGLFFMMFGKRGISALELQNHLYLKSYSTAWGECFRRSE
ncbi:MAG: hypothetical protein H6622_03155 [Halobacteriovoraceae bacterium]|nr:hypothetical protein [Halobacteriovoraceae bacterium]